MSDADCLGTAPGEPATVLHQWLDVFIGVRWMNTALFAEVTASTGLPESSFHVLSYLLGQPEHRAPMVRLAHHLGFSTAGITKVTDRLTAGGMLERHACPTDRRVVHAVLTADGIAMARRANAVLENAVRDVVIPRTGERDFAQLAEIMAKLRKALPAPA